MSPEEYKQQVKSIESLLEMLKGNTPKEDIEKLRKEWIQQLEDKSQTLKGGTK